jgi:hypothetical protein
MTIFAKSRAAKMALRIAALAGMTAGLSACYTDFGLGYASDGYGYNNYDCDPYSPFDSYYGCDYGYGFSNIGYGGGWYDNFYYPGHGIFVFDSYGSRFNMRDNHRRYWGGQRFNWQREHYRGGRHQNGNQGGGYYPQQSRRDHNGDRDHRDGNGQGGGHHDGRVGNGRHNDGDRRGNNGWQGRGNPAGAVGVPPVASPQPGRGEGYGRGGRGEGDRRGGRGSGNPGFGAVGVPQVEGDPRMRDGTMGRRQERRSEGFESRRGSYTPPPQQAAPQPQQPQQISRPAPERRTARPEARDQRRSRNRDIENQVEQ